MTVVKKKRLAVVQTGGPSAVINSTLAGIVVRVQEEGCSLFGYRNAFEGVLAGERLNLISLTQPDIRRLRETPGAYLGSSRLFLTPELFEILPQCLARDDITTLLLIGGNGTMYAAAQLEASAKQQNLPLAVLGVPKTVDNDLCGIEYAPGYGSAARYVAQAVRDIGLDLFAMKTFEQVRIVETMGRSSGWLAASAGLASLGGVGVPHGIYMPEYAFDEEDFLMFVQKVYKAHGYALLVVGEGIHDAKGRVIGDVPFAELTRGSRIFGGASSYLARQVQEKLGLRARAIDLNMPQRCFQPMRSIIDENLAYALGCFSVTLAIAGKSGVMVSCKPLDKKPREIPLTAVGGKERHVPNIYYDVTRKMVTPTFLAWLQKITGPLPDAYITLPNKK